MKKTKLAPYIITILVTAAIASIIIWFTRPMQLFNGAGPNPQQPSSSSDNQKGGSGKPAPSLNTQQQRNLDKKLQEPATAN